ncbi:MAG: DNA cytosine methyltransferase [Candidatus Cloacimonas sp.]|jgi:DNA (cytosine-5)-methyltransferase 1|nr:DNA cytosine methyltransferase [Candidatus Cloacimonas sp.]
MDKPAQTITTRFDTPSGGRFIHPIHDRTLSPREGACIQSFPDGFVFKGTKSSVYKQIGNAVPPKLAYFFARLIKYKLQGG